jgi:hypothetical protein
MQFSTDAAFSTLSELPFLESICWQGQSAAVTALSEAEILQMYERNWRYRGVIADLGEVEKTKLFQLATKHQSWLASELALQPPCHSDIPSTTKL